VRCGWRISVWRRHVIRVAHASRVSVLALRQNDLASDTREVSADLLTVKQCRASKNHFRKWGWQNKPLLMAVRVGKTIWSFYRVGIPRHAYGSRGALRHGILW